MIFDYDVVEFLKNHLQETPTILREKILQLFGVDFSTKQLSDKLKVLRKSSSMNVYSKPDISKNEEKFERIIERTPEGVKSTNLSVNTTNLTPNEVLELHGLSIDEFELVRMWFCQRPNGSYKSSIFAKPKVKGVTVDEIVTAFKSQVQPVNLGFSKKPGKHNYLLNFADIHFGVSKFQDLVGTLTNIEEFFSSENDIDTVYINLLGDEFHSSQINKSVTLSGTILQDVNMPKAIEDSLQFFDTLFKILSKRVHNIQLYRTPGNHDDPVSYMLIKVLEVKYPSIKINNTSKYRTYYKAGRVGVMLTHGDSCKKQDYTPLFLAEAKDVISGTDNLLVLTGHRHSELVEQNQALTLYQIGTNKPNDSWEISKGFVKNSRKRNWQIMKLNQSEIIGVHYI